MFAEKRRRKILGKSLFIFINVTWCIESCEIKRLPELSCVTMLVDAFCGYNMKKYSLMAPRSSQHDGLLHVRTAWVAIRFSNSCIYIES